MTNKNLNIKTHTLNHSSLYYLLWGSCEILTKIKTSIQRPFYLLDYIEQLIFNGGIGNFVIFNFGEYFIQFGCDRGALELQGEAIGSEYLLEENKLNDEQIKHLLKLGWKEPNSDISGGNYYIKWPVASEEKREDLIGFIYTTAYEVYGHTEILEDGIILNLE